MNDLQLLYTADEELQFEYIDINTFQIWARYKGHSFLVQLPIEDAVKLRDWLNDIIIASQE